ncbi:MAG: hypothetical protein ACRCU2_28790 [Planktothrix sp.]
MRDEQLEQDIADGHLEAFAPEAIAKFEAGHCRKICGFAGLEPTPSMSS